MVHQKGKKSAVELKKQQTGRISRIFFPLVSFSSYQQNITLKEQRRALTKTFQHISNLYL